MRCWMGVVAWCVLAIAAVLAPGLGGTRPATAAPPSFVVILTDDQSENMLDSMALSRRIVGQPGITFRRAYVEFALCSPSRATLLTGRYAHNHAIVSNQGAFTRMIALETETVAFHLQQAGYRTAHVGKYINQYPSGRPQSYVPRGWTHWASLVGTASRMTGYTINRNGTILRPSSYQTDFLSAESVRFIRQSVSAGRPFLLYLSTSAPHRPNVPASRHAGLFPSAVYPRTPAFNEADVSDKPPFLQFPSLEPSVVAAIDANWRNALRQLQAVDEAVRSIRNVLRDLGVLANTYVIFTSDNGAHDGEHRLGGAGQPGFILGGKQLMYETDIRVPLLIRGPGVPAGRVDDTHLVVNTDLAPTLLDLAGLPVPATMDGRSLRPLLTATPPAAWRNAVALERWLDPLQPSAAPTARGLRSQRYTWVEWATGERARALRQHQRPGSAREPRRRAGTRGAARHAGRAHGGAGELRRSRLPDGRGRGCALRRPSAPGRPDRRPSRRRKRAAWPACRRGRR